MAGTTYSTDEAIAALAGAEPDEEAVADAVEASPEPDEADAAREDTEIDPESETSTDERVDDRDGAEEPTVEDDAGEQEEPDIPAIDPPPSMDAVNRERFASLPREQQEFIAERERALTADYTRKTQEVAQKRKATEATLERVSAVAKNLEAILEPKAKAVVEWRNVDWAALAQEVSKEQYQTYRAQFQAAETEYAELHRMVMEAKTDAEAASSEIETADLQQHYATERKALEEIAPHLVAPESGQKRINEIFRYLRDDGFTEYQLRWITAKEMAVVDDALNWRAYQKAKATKPTLKPVADAKAKGKSVRPSPRPASSNHKDKATQRFKSAPSSTNAIEALLALDD